MMMALLPPGIRNLVEVAKEYGEVVVVAPDSPQSAQGHSITIEEPLRLRPVDVFEGVQAYECSGTPVDCVKIAKYVVFKDRKIDLCVSGINHGSNASSNVLYSGTMSAATEAAMEGILSIGFSLLDYRMDADFSAAQHYAHKLIKHSLEKGLANANLLNVNIPKLPVEAIKGMRICRQAKGYWAEDFQEAEDPQGRPYYWLTGKFEYQDNGTDDDIHALEEGYVSVVPITYDMTQYNALDKLKGIEEIG
jgi:5'-nucleotidase